MLFRRMGIQIAASALAGFLSLTAGGPAASVDIDALGTDDRVPITRSDRFVVAEAFAIGGRIGDRAVSAVGLSFQTYFYPLVETDAADVPLDTWTLGRSADDTTLIAMIGGENKVVVSLSAIHRLIARTDGPAARQSNFAYARSPVNGRLWAIHWTLNEAGEWLVGAVFVPHPDLDWPAGARLFAPKISGEEQRPQQCSTRSPMICFARP